MRTVRRPPPGPDGRRAASGRGPGRRGSPPPSGVGLQEDDGRVSRADDGRRPAGAPLIVHAGTGLVGGLVLLAVLAATVGLAAAGWIIGVGYLVGLTGMLVRAVWRSGRTRLGPADAVTLTRAVLVGGLTALIADSFRSPDQTPVVAMVALATVALALDAVDGRVARRTGTVTAVGARFDMEVDAFLVLVLSVYDVRLLGGWVLLIGLARYLLVAAGWVLPWLPGPTPPRFWAKVVAAVQGVVLTVAMAGLLPRPVMVGVVLVALVMLAESFGRQVWWRYRYARPAPEPGRGPRRRRVRAAAATIAAAGLVWFALLGPSDPADLGSAAVLRIPVEAVVGIALVLMLPTRYARPLVLFIGVMLGLLAVVRLLDLGFRSALGRPFNPVSDWRYTPSFIELLGRSLGGPAATVTVIVIAVALVGLLIAVPLAVRRLIRLTGRDRGRTYRFVGAFAVIWLVAAVVGLQVTPGVPVAAADAAGLAHREVTMVRANLADRQAFAGELAAPAPRPLAAGLAGLRGKDVLLVYVESYGRVAVQDPVIGPGVTAVLETGTTRLADAGFRARSAFLTSPTFGGISWLAHSTVQSGLWVDSQQRYDQLMASDRPTLTSMFGAAGWRTVLDVPANQRDWPEATTFYRADQVYDARNVEYAGPGFGFATIPDQYTLAFLQRTELAPAGRAPVMAEIDLQTSHTPWAPLPPMVDWADLGDGTVYGASPSSADELPAGAAAVRSAYGRAIEYSLTAVISFALNYGDDDLVLVLLGDHQPAPVVSGDDAGRDVPVTIISKDPAVTAAIGHWGWEPGLHPSSQAPVWRMDAFHHRFLDAFAG